MLNKHLVTYFFAVLLGLASQSSFAEEQRFNFDQTTAGGLPSGWIIAATNPDGPLAEWQVKADPAAVSSPQVLAITRIRNESGDVFNLCWTHDLVFQNGSIEVNVRADNGKEDQGGGLIWRAQDADNYYVVRYNPLEINLRLYFVKEGRRTQLASADVGGIRTGEWFRLKIVQQGERIEAYLNGKQYLEASDDTFLKAGGVGFWSKADAASSFDDLQITTP
jgi:hypothetical protein